jgi:DNA-3-methyladenine glycosylase II
MSGQLALALPAGYRVQDLRAFHGRDAEAVAEQVEARRLRKGIVLDGVPVLLDIALDLPEGRDGVAHCDMLADGALAPGAHAHAVQALQGVLGLRLDPQPFMDFAAGNALLAPLVRRQPGLRVMQSATVFEALTWAIMGQQINLSFAIALRRTFVQQAGRRHSSGLWCYPDAADAARLDIDQLTSRKFSRAKAETLLRLAHLVADGALDLELTPANDIGRIAAALLGVKGIGPWTVNYALLRGYAHADCSLHGDVAIRAALQTLLQEDAKPDMARTEQILQQFSPHRTMAAAHLWASL